MQARCWGWANDRWTTSIPSNWSKSVHSTDDKQVDNIGSKGNCNRFDSMAFSSFDNRNSSGDRNRGDSIRFGENRRLRPLRQATYRLPATRRHLPCHRHLLDLRESGHSSVIPALRSRKAEHRQRKLNQKAATSVLRRIRFVSTSWSSPVMGKSVLTRVQFCPVLDSRMFPDW